MPGVPEAHPRRARQQVAGFVLPGRTERVAGRERRKRWRRSRPTSTPSSARMRVMNTQRLGGFALLQSHSYAHAPNAPSLTDGAPGLVETSGLGSTSLVRVVGADKADAVLPPGPSKADIPAVWMIDPTGYANWDGTIRGIRAFAHIVSGCRRRPVEDRYSDQRADSEFPGQAAAGAVSVRDRCRGPGARRRRPIAPTAPAVMHARGAQPHTNWCSTSEPIPSRRGDPSARGGRDGQAGDEHLPRLAAGVHLRRARPGGRSVGTSRVHRREAR